MFSCQYGVSCEEGMRWTRGIGVSRDYKAHTVSLSQET